MKKEIKSFLLFIVFVVVLIIVSFSFYNLGYNRGRALIFNRALSNKEIKSGELNKAKIRIPLFIEQNKVKQRSRFRFTYDRPVVLRDYNEKYGINLIAGDNDDFTKARNLMKWVRRLWQPSTPKIYPPINADIIIGAIKSGQTSGFCAQYNYVFVQSLHSLGIKARYVSIKGHEVTEVYIKEINKWILFDPTYVLLAKIGGSYLSVYDIHQKVFENNYRDIKLEQLLDDVKLEDYEKYLGAYGIFAVWIKNDFITSPVNFYDIERYKVYYIDSPEDILKIPFESLYTFYREDLYDAEEALL